MTEKETLMNIFLGVRSAAFARKGYISRLQAGRLAAKYAEDFGLKHIKSARHAEVVGEEIYVSHVGTRGLVFEPDHDAAFESGIE